LPQDIGDLAQFATLVDIFKKLRAPDGCPWDLKQTHASLRENLMEESYEVLQALDEGDPAKLKEELGDLLMQIVFHAQISAEAGQFTIADVIQAINAKLIRRHPHIFGNAPAKDAAEVAHNWEEIKKTERPEAASVLESAPQSLPALAYSQEVQDRVARLGFDWKDYRGVLDKVAEEAGELKDAPAEHQAEEYGDLLFTLVSIARWLNINAETALREANRKFYTRFTWMEAECRRRGLVFKDLSFAEQNTLWEQAKRAPVPGHSDRAI